MHIFIFSQDVQLSGLMSAPFDYQKWSLKSSYQNTGNKYTDEILFCILNIFLVMVNTEGFVEYIVELIYNMASKTADHLRANPLVIAHCIGAMNIITAISIAQESHVNMIFFLVT